jgi:hypothetical protein
MLPFLPSSREEITCPIILLYHFAQNGAEIANFLLPFNEFRSDSANKSGKGEKMKQDETPHIELFMYSLNQEFPASKGHVTFLKKRSELRVDEKTGEFYTLQEVESQVYSTRRIRNEPLASEKVPMPDSTPGSDSPQDDTVAAAVAVLWTAQWAQNGWAAQWAWNSTYTNT